MPKVNRAMNPTDKNTSTEEADLVPIVVAIYARYSSDMQNAESANDQIARIKYYANKELLRLIKYPSSRFRIVFDENWIIKDEAESGKIASRSGYERILQGIRENKFQALIVDDLSRLTRSLGDQIHLYDILQYRGTELYSLCEGISSESPNAKTFFQIKGMVNELGNDLNALRTRRGKETRALKGFSTGDCPYGYDSTPTQTQCRGGRDVPSHYQISINPEQARVIEMIDNWFLSGWGRAAISRELNRRGIPSSKRGWRRTGEKYNWSTSGILYILKNARYSGYWDWGKTKMVTNPETKKKVRIQIPENEWIQHFEGKEVREDLIIRPMERWKRILNKFAQNKSNFSGKKEDQATIKPKPGTRASHLLTGILKCSCCKGPMILVASKYYGCFNYYRKAKCQNKRVLSRRKIESRVATTLRDTLLDEKSIDQTVSELNERIQKRLRVAPEEVERLRTKKDDLGQEIQNLMDFIVLHGNTSQYVKDSLEAKETEMVAVESRIKFLASARVDQFLMTPFSLRAKFENLFELFKVDPVLANIALRNLIPNGLQCTPTEGVSDLNTKCLNQNNSRWLVMGELAVRPDMTPPTEAQGFCSEGPFPVAKNPLVGAKNQALGGVNTDAKSDSNPKPPSASHRLPYAWLPNLSDGGEQGIRTLETREDPPVFKTGAFNHSASSPLTNLFI